MADDARTDTPDLWPAHRPRPYANHLEIAFSLSEVELCFAQGFDADGRAQPKCWVQTTPVHLVSFGRAITRTIAGYEDRFGRIPDAAGDMPMSRQ